MQTPFTVRRNLLIEVVHNSALTVKYTLEFSVMVAPVESSLSH
jgi:hypothetical protein